MTFVIIRSGMLLITIYTIDVLEHSNNIFCFDVCLGVKYK